MNKYKYIKLNLKSTYIQIHWSNLFIFCLFVAFSLFTDTPLAYSTVLICIFFIILLHELGHYYLINKFNLITFSISIFPLVGYCDYNLPNTEYEESIVAWGGVLFQSILMIPFLIIFLIKSEYNNLYLQNIIHVFGPLNLVFILTNLLPISILDGTKCWKSIPLFLKFGFVKFPKKIKSPEKRTHKTSYSNFNILK